MNKYYFTITSNWLWLFIIFLTIVIKSNIIVNAVSISSFNNNNNINIKFNNNFNNITYDGRSIIINGERKLLISGSIHYPRMSEEMWPKVLRQSKDAGIDIIETYIFWNIHQPNSPNEYYLEGNANITKFLDLCKEYGLYVNLRIGPYVCAEWNYGGFPIWLKDIQGIVYRDYNDAWMKEMSKWMIWVVDYLMDYFASKSIDGPIIMAQVENEYGWLEAEYGLNGTAYANWAIEFAQSLDIGVPWIMCAQDNIEQAINTCNGFYCHDWIQQHWENYPNQPSFWTENWVGWFENWGYAIPKRPVQDMLFASSRFIAYGGSLINYYMWFGGTNLGRTSGGPGIITSYDYDAPLDEFGFPNEPKYSLSSQFHQILHKYQSDLLDNQVPKPIFLSQVTEVHSYGNNLAFLTNYGMINIDNVQFNNTNYTIQPWSVLIVYNNEIVFDTSYLPPGTIFHNNTRDHLIPLDTSIINIQYLSDFDLVSSNDDDDDGGDQGVLNNYPLNSLSITNDTTDYCWYITNVTNVTDCSNTGGCTLTINGFYDYVHVYVDNIYQGSCYSPYYQLTLNNLSNYQNFQLQILTLTIGLENYAPHMESYTRGITGTVLIGNTNITNNQWLMKSGLNGENIKIYNNIGSNSDDSSSGSNINWLNYNSEPSSLSSTNSILTWYKLNISLNQLPSNDIETTVYALNMTGMNKGMIYVNGYSIGRYWLIQGSQSACNITVDTYIGIYDPSNYRIDCKSPSQSIYNIPLDWLFNTTTPNYATIIIIEELGIYSNPNQIQLLSNKN